MNCTLHGRLPPGAIHLSTWQCAAHRTILFRHVRHRLAAGDELRVVSTSLVEAGVDLDFPVVFRAMTGLDSLAQAAGRCNRNGRLEIWRSSTRAATAAPFMVGSRPAQFICQP